MAENEKAEVKANTKGKSSIVLILLIALLAGGAGAGGGVMIGRKGAPRKSAANSSMALPNEGAGPEINSLLPLGESLVVNLADQDARAYLRVGVQLGLAKPPKQKGAGETLDVTPIARDILVTVFSAKNSEELISAAGKEKVKQELTGLLQKRLPQEQVKEVYFTEFLVQR